MAEGLFKQALIDVNKSDCAVSSAGLSALVGHPPDPNACLLMRERGIDISDYRARRLNQEMIRKSELILVMELNQKYFLEENEPTAKGKIFRLGEWEKFDIADPYQKEIQFFERTLSLIELSVSRWMEVIESSRV